MSNLKNYLKKFLFVISAKKSTLVILLSLFLCTSLLDALGIGLVGPFMGLATNPDLVNQKVWLAWIYKNSGLSISHFIALLGLGMVITFYVKSFFYFQVQKYILSFSISQLGILRMRLLHGYLSVNYAYHLNKNSAFLLQNVIKETFLFCYSVTLPLLNLMVNLLVVCTLMLLLLGTHFWATVSILVILLFAFTLYNQFKEQMAYWGKEGSESDTEMIRIINHGIGGIKETRVVGCEPYFENQMSIQVKRHASTASLAQVWQQLPRIVLEALLVTVLIGFISVSLILNQNPENLVSILSIFAVASIRLLPSASQLMSAVGTLRNSSYSLNRLYSDLKELELDNVENKRADYNLLFKAKSGALLHHKVQSQKFPFAEEIIINEVDYSYPGIPGNVLQKISLTIKKGESIAFIGKSGAGKTTLVDVILGLLMPTDGDIQVDGVSIYKNLRAWQNMIGYIPQTIFLIDDTVERNIAFGVTDELIDPYRLQKAIEAAQLEELISQLPNGIKTSVGERGVRLSGGQRQRIGIARAIYHEREILVLDEATSALDNETEGLVTQAIRKLSATKTIIIIAHRLSTVEHCNCIYMLERGKVVKSGSYEEVVLGEQLSSAS